MGRPLVLTHDLALEIASAIESGVPLEAALSARHVDPRTLDDWLRIGRGDSLSWRSGDPVSPESQALCAELAASVATARARLEEKLSRKLVELAESGSREDATQLKAATTLLTIHPSYKQRWGIHVDVEHKGSVDHRLQQLDQAPTIEVLELAGDEFKALLPPPQP